LAHDENLWDREWAIGQLAARPSDPAAAQALAQAARHADYPLTRRQAVEALGGFAPAAALAAVKGALADTSAAVRGAAAAALGQLATAGGAGTAEIAPLLRDRFEHDSSYEVQAQAVAAFAQADTAHADELLARAVHMPSYQESIRHAAFQAIAQHNDTARIADAEALIDIDGYPAQVLGVFASRGNAHALDILLRYLNDSRAGVRRYVVDGVSLALSARDHAAVLDGVSAAVDGITHPETRKAVQALVDRARAADGKPK
jgi:HEAT repeat protein